MSKLRALIEQGPALVGAKNPERWANLFIHAFDEEIKDKNSVFSHKAEESIEDRLEILRGLYCSSGSDTEKVAYWINLLTLCAYSYAVAQGKTEHETRRNSLAGMLSTMEGDNLEVTSVMTVGEASTLTTWF